MRDKRICGVILAGGKSLRMGRNKALLEIEGKPLVARLSDLLSALTDEIIISSDDSAPYEAFGHPVVADRFKDQGPLAGLHSAMVFTQRPLVMLLACDLPGIKASLLRRLIALCEGFDAVIPRSTDGTVHPLCALYGRTCLSCIESNLAHNRNSFAALLEDFALNVCWVQPEPGSFFDEDLININFPKDLEVFIGRNR